jgi:hypothetical protein
MDGLQCYVRQFRNMKGRIPLDAIDAAALTDTPEWWVSFSLRGTPGPVAPR